MTSMLRGTEDFEFVVKSRSIQNTLLTLVKKQQAETALECSYQHSDNLIRLGGIQWGTVKERVTRLHLYLHPRRRDIPARNPPT
jgi:hypothetical protein